MLELNKETPIKKIVNFLKEVIVTCVMCFVALFLGFGIFSSASVENNTGELSIAQQKLESVQAEIKSTENEKESLEDKVNDLTKSKNILNEEVTTLSGKLEELKNTKIQ